MGAPSLSSAMDRSCSPIPRIQQHTPRSVCTPASPCPAWPSCPSSPWPPAPVVAYPYSPKLPPQGQKPRDGFAKAVASACVQRNSKNVDDSTTAVEVEEAVPVEDTSINGAAIDDIAGKRRWKTLVGSTYPNGTSEHRAQSGQCASDGNGNGKLSQSA